MDGFKSSCPTPQRKCVSEFCLSHLLTFRLSLTGLRHVSLAAPSCMKKHPIPSPCKRPPVNRSTNLAGAGAASPLPTSTRRALMLNVGVTAVQERAREEREGARERDEKERGEGSLRVVLLARRKDIPPWVGLHSLFGRPMSSAEPATAQELWGAPRAVYRAL